jgi:hypothetical protein
MAKSATALKATSDQRAARRSLCQELLGLRRRYATVFLQIDDLKATLVKLATDADDGSFREIFDHGQVTVAGCKPRQFKGHMPIVDVKTYDALSASRRKKLEDEGIIRVTAQFSGEFYGRCSVKLFA